MQLIDDLIANVDYPDAIVRDVRVGVTWTGVLSERCGLAKTYGIPVAHKVRIRDAGKLIGKRAIELAEYAKSWNQVEASIGVAALNSMLEPKGQIADNALHLFKEKAVGKRAVMVGRFPVSIDDIVMAAKEFWIIELNPTLVDPADHILPVTAAPSVLPKAEVVAITGSTLINQSLEHFLTLCEQAFTIVLGPSTPMLETFFRYGVNVIAGTEVVDPEPVLRVISQGGGRIHPRTFGDDIRFRMLLKT
jgi:uncharacterized protein (DUF4213/DUF364 family)